MKLPKSGLVVAVTAGMIGLMAPVVATAAPPPSTAPPGAVPPAFALTQVSGGFPGEDDYVEGKVLDVSADGRLVLYKGYVNAWDRYFQPGLFVVDRETGTSKLVWESADRPGNPGGWNGPDAAALSADGSTVVWTTRDEDVLPETGEFFREAFRTVLADGTTTRIPRSPEAGTLEPEAVDVSADGTRAAVLIADVWSDGPGRIDIVDLVTDTVVASHEVLAPTADIELSDDGSTVAWLQNVEGPLDEWENPTWETDLHVASADTFAPIATLTDHVTDPPSLDAAGEQAAYVGPEGALLIADLTAAGTPRRVVETAGSGEVRRPQLSGDGLTVVHDERKHEEGSQSSAAWSIDLTSGTAALVAGTSPGLPDDEGEGEGEGDEGSGDDEGEGDGEEPGSVLGTTAFHPIPSHDGSHVVTWLDGKIVMAVESGDAPDTTAPTWPADARLVAEPFDRDTVRLTWPAASDDRQVRGYEITADGAVVTTVPGDRTSHDVELHADDRAERVVEYGVRAIDTSGNASAPLTGSARNSAQIGVQLTGHDALKVTWEPSEDPALTGYRVLRANGGQQADGSIGDRSPWEQVGDDLPADTTELVDEGLAALTWFDYRVDVVLDDGSTRPWATRTSAHTDLPEAGELTVDDQRPYSLRVAWPAVPDSAPLLHYRVEQRQTWPVRETAWTVVDEVTRDEGTRTTIDELAPRTTYAMRVVAVLDRGWPERIVGNENTGTTLSEGITTLDVQAPRTADGVALVLDSDLVVTATGEPGLTPQLRLWPTSSHSGDPQVVVPMDEPTPGTYVSRPYRLDGTMTAIGYAEVALTDGTRTLTRGVTVAPVSGRLALDIAAARDDLGALKAVFNGPRGKQEQPVTAPGTFAVPVSPGLWSVQLIAGDGEVVATRSLLNVAAATEVAVSLAPNRAATLDVTLTGPAGQPLPAGTLTVRDDQGGIVTQRRLGQATPSTSIAGMPGHSRLTLDYRFDDQSLRVVQPRVTVDTTIGRTAVPLSLEAMAEATSDVAVTGAGKPVGGAAVKLAQTADGRTFTTTATTGGDGKVVLTGLAGAGSLSAMADFHVPAAKPVDLVAGQRGDLTIDLPRTPTYRVRPHLIVVSPDGERVEQPLDWRTATHFNASLRLGAGSTLQNRTISQIVAYDGAAGDRVELCADGREANLPKGCTSLVLGDDRDVDITLELAQVGSARAELVDERGQRVQNWTASVYRTVAGGRAEYAGTRSGSGSPVLGFASAGLYTITWKDGTGRKATTDAVVEAGSTVDLGRVVLSAASTAPADATVQALPDPVMPGGLLVVRVDLPASDTTRSQLRVRIPAGTSAEAGTATVDGTKASSTVTDGTVVVPLSGRGATVVRVPLTVGSDVLDGELSAPVTLGMSDGKVLDLPPTSAQVRRISMDGPTETAGAFTVRGRAPAGTPVAVRDEAGRVLGEAVAGAGGRWTARVDLVSPLEGTTYRLVAVTTAAAEGGTVESLSEPLFVRWSRDNVQPVSITLDNSISDARGRAVTWDPRTGNAAPTLVYVPQASTKLTARFEDASRVRGFTAYIGSLEKEGTCTATECTATFGPMSSGDVGEIALGYSVDARPVTNDPKVRPSLEELVAGVPHPFNQPENPVFEVEGPEEFTGRWTNQDSPMTVRSTLGESRVLGEATETDRDLTAAVGAPMRNLEVRIEGTGPDAALVISSDVAVSWLEGNPAGLSAAETLAEESEFKRLTKTFGLGKALFDLLQVSRHGADSPILDGLQDHVDLNIRACQPEIAAELQGYIDDAKATLVMHKLALNAMAWMAVAEGSWVADVNGEQPKAAGAINFVINQVVGAGVKWMGQQFVDRAVERVKAVDMKSCDPRLKFVPKEYKPGAWPVAKPTWIFDPSGYVYEALGTQRLEGVTATVLSGPTPEGPWTVWDAEAFGQTNPQSTSVEGTYGWDVPQGWWMVRYEKEGYRTAHSEALQVLPEHYGVDIDLHRLAPPALTAVTATADGAVEIVFDEWMSSDSVRAALTVRAGTTAVPGTLTAVGEQRSPEDVALARTFRFVPTAPFGSAQVLTVTVPGTVVDHGAVPIGADAVRTVTAPTRPDAPPACAPLTLSVSPGGQVRKGTTVSITVTGAPGAQVTVRALTSASVLDWLRAVLTGQLEGSRPWAVVGSGQVGANGKATFTYRADRDTLLQAGQQNCLFTGRIGSVDVK